MTRASIREYTEAVRGRYLLVSKAEKGKILDEFARQYYEKKQAEEARQLTEIAETLIMGGTKNGGTPQ